MPPFGSPPPGRPRGPGGQFSNRTGTFDPNDTRHVKHTRLGVWDLYEEHEPKLARIPGSAKLEKYLELFEGLPYVWRMVRDVLSIPTCAFLLAIYAATELGQAIFPALGLWYVPDFLPLLLGWTLIRRQVPRAAASHRGYRLQRPHAGGFTDSRTDASCDRYTDS